MQLSPRLWTNGILRRPKRRSVPYGPCLGPHPPIDAFSSASPPPHLEQHQRRRHGGVERLHRRLHGDGQAQAGAGEEGGGEAGAFGAHGEDEGASERRIIEIYAVGRPEGGPAGGDGGPGAAQGGGAGARWASRVSGSAATATGRRRRRPAEARRARGWFGCTQPGERASPAAPAASATRASAPRFPGS